MEDLIEVFIAICMASVAGMFGYLFGTHEMYMSFIGVFLFMMSWFSRDKNNG